MKPIIATRILFVGAILTAIPVASQALQVSWQMTNVIVMDGPGGLPVEAIQSNPAGQPLILGRPELASGIKRFQPSLWDGSLVFHGSHTAHVADFWKNFRTFSAEVDVSFDSVNQDQTLLRVAGVWEIRLIGETGLPELQFIGWREPRRPQSVSLFGIEANKKYEIRAHMQMDGTMILELGSGESATTYLGQPPASSGEYPELFVGSSNPERFSRALQGSIHRLQIHAR